MCTFDLEFSAIFLSNEIKLSLVFNVHNGKVSKEDETPLINEYCACFLAE